MFETVSPPAKQSRVLWYKTLPASLLLHGALAGTAILGGLGTASFPSQPPRMTAVYNLTEEPPPPPPPPPAPAAAKAQPAQPPSQQPPPAREEIVAPSIIPDVIIPVSAPVVAERTSLTTGSGGVAGGIEGGVAGGGVGGGAEGVKGGEVDGTVGGTMGGVVYIGRDQPLRMFPLSQVYPIYPEKARVRGWEDQLVVRYVIGTNGKVREVTILQPAERRLFEEATLHAIRHWRFRPMIKDGQAQEVVHELTIYYRLEI